MGICLRNLNMQTTGANLGNPGGYVQNRLLHTMDQFPCHVNPKINVPTYGYDINVGTMRANSTTSSLPTTPSNWNQPTFPEKDGVWP